VVALGFSFFENILYAYSFISLQGVEQELLRLVFFRSFFTVALHVLCAMLVA
jgi:RsiW-degrading membrane proteinase PrsW (M82 family)